jgi:hypothetical protein
MFNQTRFYAADWSLGAALGDHMLAKGGKKSGDAVHRLVLNWFAIPWS